MAQRTENEETEFKVVPETLQQTTIINLCIKNCGVIGNPSTNNMCQNCFTASTTILPLPPSSSSSRSVRSPKRSHQESLSEEEGSTDHGLVDEKMVCEVKRVVSRCSGCRRKVGLAGFRCRCGELFCADHRYSDRHDCGYDYKKVGREAIARENPVIRAAKIVKV